MKRRRLLSYHAEPGLFWLRVFGKGFSVRNTAKHPLMFSERNGYTDFWTVRRLR